MVNSELIKEKMRCLGINQDYVAEKLKITQGGLNQKINNSRDFNIHEMFLFADILELEPSEIREYFLK